MDAKIIKQHANGAGRQPWILCGPNADLGKREALEAGGAKVVAVALDPHTGDFVMQSLHGIQLTFILVPRTFESPINADATKSPRHSVTHG